jgi:hypothetical protein
VGSVSKRKAIAQQRFIKPPPNPASGRTTAVARVQQKITGGQSNLVTVLPTKFGKLVEIQPAGIGQPSTKPR